MSTRRPILFISGPMRGYPDYNHSAFNEVAQKAADLDYVVLNPAILPTTLPDEAYMPICLAMLNTADFIFLLPGSENSVGSLAEQAFARAQEISIIDNLKTLESRALWWEPEGDF
jgi:hypothetical protein